MKLTKTDKAILDSYARTLEGLSDYLGKGYEIILHSLETLESSVIAIENGFHSGRELGAPVTDLALSMLSDIENDNGERKYRTYNAESKDGVPLRSSTIPVYGEGGRIIGLLCMNFYTDTPFSEVFRDFGPSSAENSVKEHFTNMPDDLLSSVIGEVKSKVYSDSKLSNMNKNKEVISILYGRGVFSLKDSVQKTAQALSISKNTVYMHIRACKEKKDSQA